MEIKQLYNTVTDKIRDCGVPASLKGYNYLRDAIIIAVNDGDSRKPLHKGIYVEIAEKYGDSCRNIERAIRNAIEVAWDRGNIDTMNRIFGYTVSQEKGNPTNGEFIFLLADDIMIQNDILHNSTAKFSKKC